MLYTFYCVVLHLAELRKCRTFVHYYCSVEVFNQKFDPAYFAFFGKIYSPFCLQNCLFLFTAYFAKILLANFVKAYCEHNNAMKLSAVEKHLH